MSDQISKKYVLLSVEDNPGDRLLIHRHFGRNPRFELHFVEDGVLALQFLKRLGTFHSHPRPDFVLLDLNLQKKDGRQVLAEVKGDPLLKDIPVFVLTTSKSPDDKKHCLDLGAAHFFTKPSQLKPFEAVLKYIEAWIEDPGTKPPDESSHSFFGDWLGKWPSFSFLRGARPVPVCCWRSSELPQ